VALESQIPVQARCVVLLDDETGAAPRPGLAPRLGRDGEVALRSVGRELLGRHCFEIVATPACALSGRLLASLELDWHELDLADRAVSHNRDVDGTLDQLGDHQS